MRTWFGAALACACVLAGGCGVADARADVTLPAAATVGAHSLPELLQRRRSVRDFAGGALSAAQLAQLLWAAQGITASDGRRTAPSAGALHPLELYVIAGEIEGVPAGVYRYDPAGHRLVPTATGDRRAAVAAAAVGQAWIAAAPAVIVFGAVEARTAVKYGDRASRYVAIEAGHAAQSLLLRAVDLGLAAADVGAFDDPGLARTLQLPPAVTPLLLIPVGAPGAAP